MRYSLFLFCLLLNIYVVQPGYLGEFGDEFDEDDPDQIGDKWFFELDTSWPADDVFAKLGPISAAVHSKQNADGIFVLHRADRVWDDRTFDHAHVLRNKTNGPIPVGVLAVVKNGRLQDLHFKNRFYMPHGLSVDREGNIWITDVGLHQVFKFGPDFDETPLLTLGEELVPGNDSEHFCKPTHVVVAPNGDFFVADGYCNHRIMKFNSKGKFITQWGGKSTNSTNAEEIALNIPHQMALIEEKDMLAVADRENGRVVFFRAGIFPQTMSGSGRYMGEFGHSKLRSGPVYGVAYEPSSRTLSVLTGSTEDAPYAEVVQFDMITMEKMDRLTDWSKGFGEAHTISVGDSDWNLGDLLISSVEPPSADEFGQPERRLWLYHRHSVRHN